MEVEMTLTTAQACVRSEAGTYGACGSLGKYSTAYVPAL